MASKLGPIPMDCDAPSYLIVQACEKLDFDSPLDVRWQRMVHFLSESPVSSRLWNFFFTKSPTQKKSCSCGKTLPTLEDYAFTFACGKVMNYALAQCPHCRTIFWELEIPSENPIFNETEI